MNNSAADRFAGHWRLFRGQRAPRLYDRMTEDGFGGECWSFDRYSGFAGNTHRGPPRT